MITLIIHFPADLSSLISPCKELLPYPLLGGESEMSFALAFLWLQMHDLNFSYEKEIY
jgi:hypothetical protein